MSIASISGTLLAVITASLLKPLLSSNQSLQLPLVAYGQYNNVLPFEAMDKDSDRVTNLFLTLRLPQLLTNSMDPDFDMKRQFDPWGGKRHSKSFAKDEDIGRKRQFSPWGGKRSYKGNYHPRNNELTDASFQLEDLVLSRKNRGFNSWGGKRSSNSWNEKRNFKLKDLKRNFNSWGGKRDFNSWGGKRDFNSWGGKRNFNAWGGKRSENDPNASFDETFSEPKKNTNIGSKRQSFNAWGGKRSFNSWGGKRGLRLMDEKRVANLEPEIKELNIQDSSSPYMYNASIEERERNKH